MTLRDRRTVRRPDGPVVCGGLPGRLHQRRAGRRSQVPHRSGRLHRMRLVPRGVSERRDLRDRRPAREYGRTTRGSTRPGSGTPTPRATFSPRFWRSARHDRLIARAAATAVAAAGRVATGSTRRQRDAARAATMHRYRSRSFYAGARRAARAVTGPASTFRSASDRGRSSVQRPYSVVSLNAGGRGSSSSSGAWPTADSRTCCGRLAPGDAPARGPAEGPVHAR